MTSRPPPIPSSATDRVGASFLARIEAEVRRDPAAEETGALLRLEPKIQKLLHFFPDPTAMLEPFFAIAIHNHSIRDNDLDNALKFLEKRTEEERARICELVVLCFSARDEAAIRAGMTAQRATRDLAKKVFLATIENLRTFTAKFPFERWEPGPLRSAAGHLDLEVADVMTLVRMRPRILRGLRKPPRPVHAWPVPLLLSSLVAWLVIGVWPTVPFALLYAITMSILIASLWVLCTRLAVAPGVLCYAKTGSCLRDALRGGGRGQTAILSAMAGLGIDTEEYSRAESHENADAGVRIVIRDKRCTQGAVEFLTSSEAIGNCIALRNFVSWTLPSYLDDDGIMLADVYCRGSRRSYSQRGQVWMVAAECLGKPVLVVNSVELNNEGARYLEVLMPEVIAMLRDVARRAGFEKIYVGVSEFGRDFLDRNFEQGTSSDPVYKVHAPAAGYRYHFDVFRLRGWSGERRYRYVKSRGLGARCYAIVFGVIEWLGGRREKARTFFDSAKNAHNFWDVPLEENSSLPDSAQADHS